MLCLFYSCFQDLIFPEESRRKGWVYCWNAQVLFAAHWSSLSCLFAFQEQKKLFKKKAFYSYQVCCSLSTHIHIGVLEGHDCPIDSPIIPQYITHFVCALKALNWANLGGMRKTHFWDWFALWIYVISLSWSRSECSGESWTFELWILAWPTGQGLQYPVSWVLIEKQAVAVGWVVGERESNPQYVFKAHCDFPVHFKLKTS